MCFELFDCLNIFELIVIIPILVVGIAIVIDTEKSLNKRKNKSSYYC